MSRKHQIWMLFICLGMLFGVSQAMFAQGAQKQKVTGTVTDESGEPLIGVTVMENGASVGAITDLDGRFTLDAPSNATLTFSYVGYLTQNVKLNGNTKVDVVLKEVGGKKLEVIKKVREITGLGLKEAKDFVENPGKAMKEGLSKEEAEEIVKKFEGTGATVVLA